jgi:hypothetical protein
MILRLSMTEQEQVDIGAYCTELLLDNRFKNLVNVTDLNLSQDMLNAATPEDREGVWYQYQGLKYFLDTMRQFVLNKDQILALNELKDE